MQAAERGAPAPILDSSKEPLRIVRDHDPLVKGAPLIKPQFRPEQPLDQFMWAMNVQKQLAECETELEEPIYAAVPDQFLEDIPMYRQKQLEEQAAETQPEMQPDTEQQVNKPASRPQSSKSATSKTHPWLGAQELQLAHEEDAEAVEDAERYVQEDDPGEKLEEEQEQPERLLFGPRATISTFQQGAALGQAELPEVEQGMGRPWAWQEGLLQEHQKRSLVNFEDLELSHDEPEEEELHRINALALRHESLGIKSSVALRHARNLEHKKKQDGRPRGSELELQRLREEREVREEELFRKQLKSEVFDEDPPRHQVSRPSSATSRASSQAKIQRT